MHALQELCEQRPENPVEFIAYYILKHNAGKKGGTAGAPIGHFHPDDPENPRKSKETP